jgi:hypothetical protein
MPKLIKEHQPPKVLTIEIEADDLYQIVYRLKYQEKLHNVAPDFSREPRKALEVILLAAGYTPYSLEYHEDLY